MRREEVMAASAMTLSHLRKQGAVDGSLRPDHRNFIILLYFIKGCGWTVMREEVLAAPARTLHDLRGGLEAACRRP